MASRLASSLAPPDGHAETQTPGALPTASAEQPPTRIVPLIAVAPTASTAGRAPTWRPRWLAGVGAVALPTLLGVALLLLWQGATQSGAVSQYLLPTPGAVAQSLLFAARDGLLLTYGLTTLQESLAGLALGALVALPLGYALAKSRWIAAALEPYLAASQAIPAVALAPLLVLWLGYGLTPVAALCALIVFFPMVVNTTLGIRRLDRDILDAARVMAPGGGRCSGASRLRWRRRLSSPGCVPASPSPSLAPSSANLCWATRG